MREILEIAKNAKQASLKLGVLTTGQKNAALMEIADALEANVSYIISENEKDIASCKSRTAGRSALIDRLKLDISRIQGMAKGVREVCALEDPIGETICGFTRPNGLDIIKKRVPLGVIGIIYEARPNVTSDAISLCIKTGNAVILKGGKEAHSSNSAINGNIERRC